MEVKLQTSSKISEDNEYFYVTRPGFWYSVQVSILAGSGTVTVKRRVGFDVSNYNAYKIPGTTTDMTIDGTGETGYEIMSPTNRIRFDVSGASGLELKIDVTEVPIGRS